MYLAILVERGGADRVKLASREHRLQHVRRVHRSFRCPGAHDGVELVDEEDDLPLRLHDLVEDGFEAIFELAAIFRAGDQRAHVERDDLLALQSLRHVLIDDAAGEAFHDGGLADAGLADEHGIVLGASRQHLNDPANLFVTSDDGIELAAAREFREVAPVLVERFVFRFGILIGDPLRASHLCEDFENPILGDAVLLQDARRDAAPAFADDTEEEMLRADELVFEALGFALSGVGDFSQAGRQRRLRAAVGGRLFRELSPQLVQDRFGLDGHLAKQGRDDAVGLLDERQKQVLGLDLGVVVLLGDPLRREDRFLRLFGVFVQVHMCIP